MKERNPQSAIYSLSRRDPQFFPVGWWVVGGLVGWLAKELIY